MTPQTRVIETARAEIGYLEKATNSQLNDKTSNAGYNNWNKFVINANLYPHHIMMCIQFTACRI